MRPNRLPRPRLALLAVAALAAAAPPAGAQPLVLEPLAVGPDRPTAVVSPLDGSGRLFVNSKLGVIQIWDGSAILPTPFLDIRDQVTSDGSERGLHGLAFHPDFPATNHFYVTYTNLASDSVLSRWSVSADPNVADPDSEEILWLIPQPQEWHNVSQLQFGPDGYLYVGAGDGGFAGDPDDRAQDLSDVLGKLHRIDVDGAFPYAIPPDNPFLDTPGARPEIWAYGLRNPWKFSFDRSTGDLYVGDVGQSAWEEVSFQPAASAGGENYGWRLMEGTHCFDPPTGCFDPSLTLPILEYEHEFFGGGCAVIGGYVYRGSRFPQLEGAYLYADYCSGEVWAARRTGSVKWENVLEIDTTSIWTAFGQDEEGELYIADEGDGTIYRILDGRPFCDLETSRDSYVEGDTVTASAVRLVNLGSQDAAVRVVVALVSPEGDVAKLVDVGDDGSFTLASGTDEDRAPLELFTVDGETPRGEWTFGCRLSLPGGGPALVEDRETFSVE